MKLKYKIVIIFLCVLGGAGIVTAGFYTGGKRGLEKNAQQMTQEWKSKSYIEELEINGEKYHYRDHVINILCMGIDKEEIMSERDDDGNSVGQADMVVLLSVDLDNRQIRVLSIPRDTMVSIVTCDPQGNPTGAFSGQLTLQYAYADGQEKSCALMTQQVADLLKNQVKIDGYVAMNLSCIGAINDAVGGVTVQMDDDYTLYNSKFTKGAVVTLHGEEAKQYVQGRDITKAGSAYARIGRQKQYMKAFVSQAKAAWKKNPLLPVTIMRKLSEDMETNLSLPEIFYLAFHAKDCDFTDENMIILKGDIVKGDVYEEYYPDEEALQQTIIDLFYEKEQK